jgi:hypothetical protein
MARKQRRTQVEEALEDERGREAALAGRLEEIVAETDGPRIDEQVFERLDPEDARLVREALEVPSAFDEDEDWNDDDAGVEAFLLGGEGDGGGPDETDEEIARLQDEIAGSRRRQLAYERYLEALDA